MIDLTDEILGRVIQKRVTHSHKGTYGRVLLIGGNAQYGGAVILAAAAAVNAGSGLVTVACDPINRSALHARLPEAMVVDYHHVFSELLQNSDVVIIGCGLGLSDENLVVFKQVLDHISEHQKLIIDGSAITLFAREKLILKFPEHTIFTPHEMELERLSAVAIGQQTNKKIQDFVDECGVMLVAKSHETRIFAPHKENYKLKIGTPAQATAGMGDTLAGMIGSFVGQFKSDEFDAILAAVYLHSRIARDAARSAYVVLPSQLINEIPKMMKKYEEKKSNF